MKNLKYSHKDYTNRSLTDVPVEELNGTIIVGSCFYQEWRPDQLSPRCVIFPEGMQGVRFVRCNLDNVWIPPGNTLEGCTNKRIRVQNDGDDWILDEQDKPIEPTNAKILRKQGKPVPRPEDIPARPLISAGLEQKREAERLEREITDQQQELSEKQARLNSLRRAR